MYLRALTGIYEDMNSVIAWQHYWNATNANESLREYAHAALCISVLFEISRQYSLIHTCL